MALNNNTFIIVGILILALIYLFVLKGNLSAFGFSAMSDNIYSVYVFQDPTATSSSNQTFPAFYPGSNSPSSNDAGNGYGTVSFVTAPNPVSYESMPGAYSQYPLTTVTSAYTYYKTNLTSGSFEGEMALLNAFFQNETIAKNYMDNTFKVSPILPTANLSNIQPGDNPLNNASIGGGTTSEIPAYGGMPFYTYSTAGPVAGSISANALTISINQVMGIPGDVNWVSSTSRGGTWSGTPGSTLFSTNIHTPSSYGTLRQNLIISVLNAVHTIFSNGTSTPASSSATANSTSTPTNGINGCLFNLLQTNYLIDQSPKPVISGVTGVSSSNIGSSILPTTSSNGITAASTNLQLSANAKHAIWLYIIARETWISNCISNIAYL